MSHHHFYVDGSQLMLLSSYPVTQTGINSRSKTWPQTIVSWVELDSGQAVSQLIPLDRQYLEAAMNAGDEGQQYLEGKPGGKLEAMMAAMKQAQSSRQGSMTPEQAAQMQASMAQVQQMMQGSGIATPGASPPGTSVPGQAPPGPSAEPAASFTVDALMRGYIRYNNSKGEMTILSLIDRQSGKELMKREYPDGNIDECISLGRYKLPVEQFGALIKRPDGEVLEDLEPDT
jgi:hypothetical protein